jgi:uncharacterized protein YrzB (UPF0473 family)
MSEEVTLVDEAGVERRFKMLDAFDLEGKSYYLVEDVKDAERVLLLREAEDGLETVGGEEFDRVMAALQDDRVE